MRPVRKQKLLDGNNQIDLYEYVMSRITSTGVDGFYKDKGHIVWEDE